MQGFINQCFEWRVQWKLVSIFIVPSYYLNIKTFSEHFLDFCFISASNSAQVVSQWDTFFFYPTDLFGTSFELLTPFFLAPFFQICCVPSPLTPFFKVHLKLRFCVNNSLFLRLSLNIFKHFCLFVKTVEQLKCFETQVLTVALCLISACFLVWFLCLYMFMCIRNKEMVMKLLL